MTQPADQTTERRTVRVRLHAVLRDLAGTDAIDVSIDASSPTPDAAFTAAGQVAPDLLPWRSAVAYGIESRITGPDAAIPASVGQIDVLPPVSGG